MCADQPFQADLSPREPGFGCCQAHDGMAEAAGGRLDPRLATLSLRVQARLRESDLARVFISMRRFPFRREGDALVPAIPGLEPGFVTDAEGAIFSRATPASEAPVEGGAAARPPYLFTSTVRVHGAAPTSDGPYPIALQDLLRQAEVEWVQAAPRLRPQLDWSLPEIGATTPRRQGARSQARGDGQGVVVGVVDFGCDFAHPNFLKPDGTTRLRALWDQNPTERGCGPATPTGATGTTVPQGRVYMAAEIDAALHRAQEGGGCPYAALGYDPHRNYYTQTGTVPEGEGAHGTHVLDIAAGNGRGTGLSGLAPGAELIFVQAPRFDWTRAGDLAQGAWVYEAAAYIFACAGDDPAVVNLSLTTNTGSHDGSNLAEFALELLLRQPGRAVVVCAGNERVGRIHAGGDIGAGASRALRWRFPRNDGVHNQLLLCHDGATMALTLRAPDGVPVLDRVPAAGVAAASYLLSRRGRTVGTVTFGQDGGPPRDPDRQPPWQIGITIRAREQDDDGEQEVWTLEMAAAAGQPVRFDAWIERDDPDQSRFDDEDASRDVTLGSLACGDSCIVVGAYNALALQRRPPAPFSAEGPTRDRRQKPDLIAPGVGVYAARSKAGNGGPPTLPRRGLSPQAGVVLSGTSQAAPHVAGVVALMFQRARELGRPLPQADDLRRILRETCRRDSLTPVAGGWSPWAGCGRLDARAAVEAVGRTPTARAAVER